MSIKSIFSLKSVTDFIYMFLSNIVKKGLGFLREIILAFFFGSSIMYANYLLLKTVADFFSQFTFGNALQVNLMPKFAKIFAQSPSVDLSKVYMFSKRSVLWMFIFSQLFQLPLIWYISPEHPLLFICLSLVLGAVVSMNFFNSIFLTILQAKGEFKKYSYATLINIFVSTVLIYPLSLLLNIFGVVLSRFIGVLSLSLTYIKPLLLKNGEVKPTISVKDFNLSLIFLGNLANIIILIARFIAGIDGGKEITFFTYSVVLINAVFTAIVVNVNTLILRIISVSKNIKVILLSLLISLFVGSILFVIIKNYSYQIVQFVFERGLFNSSDTLNTSIFLREISWSFVLIFVATTLFRPYFTLPELYLNKESKKIAIPLVVIIGLVSFSLQYFGGRESSYMSIDFISSMSILYLVAAILSFYKYYSYEK